MGSLNVAAATGQAHFRKAVSLPFFSKGQKSKNQIVSPIILRKIEFL